MSALETRYRTLLRVLPADYRAAWGDEMVATFLDSMATDDPDRAEYLADFGRPSWPEVASVLALAVRLRLGGARGAAWRDAARVVALLGVLAHASLAVVGLGNLLWLAGKIPGLTPPQGPWLAHALSRWPVTLLALSSVPAYFALLRGRLGAARVLAVLGASSVVVSAGADLLAGRPHQVSQWFAALLALGPVAGLWAFPARVERPPWLAAFPVGVAVAVGWYLLGQWEPLWPLLDWAAVCCTTVVGGALAYLAAVALRRVRLSGAWLLALGLFGAAVLAQRMLTLVDQVDTKPEELHAPVILAGLAEVGVTLAVGVLFGILANRALSTDRAALSEA
jgi:hypothetical protein